VDEAKANARLIAAAPEMLAALRLALPLLETTRTIYFDSETIGTDGEIPNAEAAAEIAEYDAAIDAIKKAIAKATHAEVTA
jgi:hypothetical protein